MDGLDNGWMEGFQRRWMVNTTDGWIDGYIDDGWVDCIDMDGWIFHFIYLFFEVLKVTMFLWFQEFHLW